MAPTLSTWKGQIIILWCLKMASISTFPRILRNFSHYSRYFSHINQSLGLTKHPNPKISGQPSKGLSIINNQHDRYWIYCNHFVEITRMLLDNNFLNHCASIIAKYWYKICCPHFEDAMHEWGQVNIVNIFRNFSIWNIIYCLKYQNTIKNIYCLYKMPPQFGI